MHFLDGYFDLAFTLYYFNQIVDQMVVYNIIRCANQVFCDLKAKIFPKYMHGFD